MDRRPGPDPCRVSRAAPTFLDGAPAAEQDGPGRAMTTKTAPAATIPLDVARALAPRIRARADEIEAARQLPKDLVMDIANDLLNNVLKCQNSYGSPVFVYDHDHFLVLTSHLKHEVF